MTEHIHPDRLRKLEELRARGVEPFAHKFDDPRPIAEAVAQFVAKNHAPSGANPSAPAASGEPIGVETRVAGRVMGLRDHGKSIFIDLKDRSGRVQVYLRKDEIGQRNLFGDFFGVFFPLSAEIPKARSEAIVVAPASKKLYFKANGIAPPLVSEVDGRQQLTFAADDLPALVVAGRDIPINGGRHVTYTGKPLANLQLTLIEKLGLPMEQFGDSNGELNLLTGV